MLRNVFICPCVVVVGLYEVFFQILNVEFAVGYASVFVYRKKLAIRVRMESSYRNDTLLAPRDERSL